jgi:hypothetical protein
LRRARDRVGRQAREYLLSEAADHELAFPVGHPVDPDHETAGGEAPQVVVALEQDDVGADTRSGDGCRRSGGAAAHHQHVAVGVHRDLTRRLDPHARSAGRQHARPLVARQLSLTEDVGVEDAFVGSLFVHCRLSRP